MRLRFADLKAPDRRGRDRRRRPAAPDVPLVDRRGLVQLRHARLVRRSASGAGRRVHRRRDLLDRPVQMAVRQRGRRRSRRRIANLVHKDIAVGRLGDGHVHVRQRHRSRRWKPRGRSTRRERPARRRSRTASSRLEVVGTRRRDHRSMVSRAGTGGARRRAPPTGSSSGNPRSLSPPVAVPADAPDRLPGAATVSRPRPFRMRGDRLIVALAAYESARAGAGPVHLVLVIVTTYKMRGHVDQTVRTTGS